MSYKQLTYEQRYLIYQLLKIGFTQTEIAENIEVHKSTISRELKRNTGKRGYRYKQALQAGAEIVQEPEDQFYGDRTANVRDPFGNLWGIATHVEDVSPEEMERRMQQG